MKRFIIVLAAVVFVITMFGSVFASDTSNVSVSATVSNTCSVLAPMTIDDIAVDLSQAGPFAESTSGTVRCTNGHNFQINVSSADVTTPTAFIGGTGVSGFKLKSGTDILNYSVISGGNVNSTTGVITGQGFSTDVTIGITASIPVTGNETAPAGNYSDTVYLTIVY
ncbi:MAG: hypothetical protein APR62_01515 [Smithella sp. SDB]|nr:MAG: hypothetical protein APR62_01515 [Smithella sp. SDB]